MICVTWLLLIDAIYSGGVCVLWVLLDGSIYLSVTFEYVSFPIGMCAGSALPGYMCILFILETYIV